MGLRDKFVESRISTTLILDNRNDDRAEYSARKWCYNRTLVVVETDTCVVVLRLMFFFWVCSFL